MGPNLEGGRLPFWWTDRTPKSEDGSQEMGMPEEWGFSWLSPAFLFPNKSKLTQIFKIFLQPLRFHHSHAHRLW